MEASHVTHYYHQSRFTADRKSTRLNSSHSQISYAVFCLKKKNAKAKSTVLAGRDGSRRVPRGLAPLLNFLSTVTATFLLMTTRLPRQPVLTSDRLATRPV